MEGEVSPSGGRGELLSGESIWKVRWVYVGGESSSCRVGSFWGGGKSQHVGGEVSPHGWELSPCELRRAVPVGGENLKMGGQKRGKNYERLVPVGGECLCGKSL